MPGKKSKTAWTKRKFQTVKWKGRAPRALMWRKPVYKEWFEYARLSLQRGGKVPKEFGDLLAFENFQSWWAHPDYGFELFCEPPVTDMVSEVNSSDYTVDDDEILIKVNLRGDREVIEKAIGRFLRSKNVPDDYVSRARFQPSRSMKHISVGVTDSRYLDGQKSRASITEFRQTFLKVEKMTDDGLSLREAAVKLKFAVPFEQWENWYPDIGKRPPYQREIDKGIKKIRRRMDAVEASFQNIAQGTFP